MLNKELFINKRVLVVGLGRSGYAAADLLSDLGAQVWVSDKNEGPLIQANAEKLKLKRVKLELGGHSPGFVSDKDLVVLSPGVDNQALPVIKAQEYRIPIISEIELGWILCRGKVIAITGTNGKTTVTTLIARVLDQAGVNVHICGNIGNPFTGQVAAIEENDYVSLEVSSFQLERINRFKPKIAVILNFSPDHLDRYRSVEEYLEAKKRIFINQDESDYLVLNHKDPILKNLAQGSRVRRVYFNTQGAENPNYQAVTAVATILRIDPKQVKEALKKFKGIEHRMEEVAEFRGIKFINDSKATNVNSTIWALDNLSSPVILIAGGRDKGLPFDAAGKTLEKKVKKLIVIGETRERLKDLFRDRVIIEEAEDLPAAVAQAFKAARKGDTILLSPMCASFDMFSDYRQRGEIFKGAVNNLIEQYA